MVNHLYKENQGSYCGIPNALEIEGRLNCTLGEFFTEEMLKEVEGASQVGDVIADAELAKLRRYQP